jgi:hypothetical protein
MPEQCSLLGFVKKLLTWQVSANRITRSFSENLDAGPLRRPNEELALMVNDLYKDLSSPRPAVPSEKLLEILEAQRDYNCLGSVIFKSLIESISLVRAQFGILTSW